MITDSFEQQWRDEGKHKDRVRKQRGGDKFVLRHIMVGYSPLVGEYETRQKAIKAAKENYAEGLLGLDISDFFDRINKYIGTLSYEAILSELERNVKNQRKNIEEFQHFGNKNKN